MLPEFSDLWTKIETRHQEMFDFIDELTREQLLFKPEPNRWSILQVLQHVILGAQGLRRSEAELRDNPLREILKPGEMVKVVMDVLINDVPVDVPDPSMEPDGELTVEELRVIAENHEQVMFSHAAAGPLTTLQMLEVAEAHIETHRRQIDRIRAELPA